jgi:hypothetical protein
MRFIQRLSVLVYAAVVALALFCQPQMRVDAAMMQRQTLPTGLELDTLIAAICDLPGEGAYVYDPENPDIYWIPGWPNYWRQLFESDWWNRLPPGHRVLCNITCPDPTEDLELARECADNLDVTWAEEDTAEEICQAIFVEFEPEWYVGGNNP